MSFSSKDDFTQPGKSRLSQQLGGHHRQRRDKWEKVKNQTYGWHVHAVQGCTAEQSRVGSLRQRGHKEWHAPEYLLPTWDWELTKKGLFGRMAAILMTSLSLLVTGGKKEKNGRRKMFPSRPLRRLTSCQERRGILTSSCWLLTITCDWSRGEYRWVSKPCLDWTERTWRGHCVVKSRSDLGGMSKRQWKFFQWSKDTKSKVKMFKWEKGGEGFCVVTLCRLMKNQASCLHISKKHSVIVQ